jgi:hypothetical protein
MNLVSNRVILSLSKDLVCEMKHLSAHVTSEDGPRCVLPLWWDKQTDPPERRAGIRIRCRNERD